MFEIGCGGASPVDQRFGHVLGHCPAAFPSLLRAPKSDVSHAKEWITKASRVYGPAEIAKLRSAMTLACDRGDLDEPLTEIRRIELARAIPVGAEVGFTDCRTLAKMALDKCRIAAAAESCDQAQFEPSRNALWAARELSWATSLSPAGKSA